MPENGTKEPPSEHLGHVAEHVVSDPLGARGIYLTVDDTHAGQGGHGESE